MDSLYGRSFQLRHKLHQEGLEYYGDIPANTQVYLEKPQIVYLPKKNGDPSKVPTILGQKAEVRDLCAHSQLESETICIRATQRGFLETQFSRMMVWTIKGTQIRQEWLFIRHGKKNTYVLSNASHETTLALMAQRKTQRYFIERDNQDAKSEFGWDEFQATKYRAWEHQLALTIMASWFITSTRTEWVQEHPQDPDLLQEYGVDELPTLSVGNVRELMRAAMPLPQLTTEQATQLVIKHLKNRTRSRKSRLKKPSRLRR